MTYAPWAIWMPCFHLLSSRHHFLIYLVGSHSGGLGSPDTSIFLYDWFRIFGYERLAYALMHSAAWQTPVFAHPGVQVGAIMAHLKMEGARQLWNSLPGVYRQCAVTCTEF